MTSTPTPTTFTDPFGRTWVIDPDSSDFGATLRRFVEQDPGQVRATLDNREHLATVFVALARLEDAPPVAWPNKGEHSPDRLRPWIEDPRSDLGRLALALGSAIGLPPGPPPPPRPPVIPGPEPGPIAAIVPAPDPEPDDEPGPGPEPEPGPEPASPSPSPRPRAPFLRRIFTLGG